jgi:Planctomycete cytochrome C
MTCFPRINARAAGLLLSLLSSACIAELEPDVGDLRAGTCRSEDSDPNTFVSYRDQILPLFQRSGTAGGCGCHQPGNKSTPGIDQAGLNLLNYATLRRGGNTSHANIVIPGDPCNSVIVQKVSNAPPTGSRMPPGGPPFMTPEEITLLRDWIAEGAHDN